MATVAERKAAKAIKQARAEWLRAVVSEEGRVQGIYASAEAQVLSRLGNSGPLPTAEKMAALIQQEILNATALGVGAAERVLSAGVRTAQSQMHGEIMAYFQQGNAKALTINVEAAVAGGETEALIIARRASSAGRVDRPALRSLLTNRSKRSARMAAEQVRTHIDAGRGVVDAARRMGNSGVTSRVTLPQWADEIVDAADQGGPALRRAARQAASSVERMGATADNLSLRNASRRLIRAAESGTRDDVRAATEQWVRRRARFDHIRIMRTEGARARTSQYMAEVNAQPAVVGVKWNLSTSHPTPDECNIYAEQDVDGFGAGVYKQGNELAPPAHSNCLCFLTAVIDPDYRKREIARLRGQPEPPPFGSNGTRQDGRAWLQTQSRESQQSILGRGRSMEFQTRPDEVLTANGTPRPLYEIQGRPSPATPMRGRQFQVVNDRVMETNPRGPGTRR